MRFLLTGFALLFFTFAQASQKIEIKDKREKLPLSVRLEQNRKEQIELKEGFVFSKKLHVQKSAKMAAGLRASPPAKTQRCDGKEKGIYCKSTKTYQRAKQTISQSKSSIYSFFGRGLSWAKSLFSSSKSTLSRTFRKLKGRTNQLPFADGLYAEKRAGGNQVLFSFETFEAMVDPDGEVVRVEYDFDDGVSMVIPIEELDEYAYVEHVFDSGSSYDVSIKIYDNEDDYSEYFATVDADAGVIPLNNFSYTNPTGTTIDFVGTVDNPDTSITNYRWNFGDGTGNFSGAGLDTTSHTFASPGVYQVTFQAWDDAGARARIRKNVYVGETVSTTMAPYPIVRINSVYGGPNRTVYFDASRSVDESNTLIESYYWNFGDFDSVDNYSYSSTPSHNYKQPGTYYGSLTITDTNDNAETYYFRVFVDPGMLATPFIYAFQQGGPLDISFDSTNWSLLANVGANKYFWDFGDTNFSSGAQAYHSYASAGTYDVALVMHDVKYGRIVRNHQITLGNDYDTPVVDLGYQNNQQQSQSYTYYAGGSYDPQEDDPLEFSWIMGDGTGYIGDEFDTITHTYSEIGYYPIRLTVTNTRGLSDSRYGAVQITNGFYLQSQINFSPKTGGAPLNVDFDSSYSYAEQGISRVIWQFHDDTGSEQTTTSKTYDVPGVYWVKLLIRDNDGNESVNYREVTVFDWSTKPANNQPPRAQFKVLPNDENGSFFKFDASDSFDQDGEASLLYYEWIFDGNPGPDGRVVYRGFSPGTHTVSLKVIDVWGATHTLEKTFKTGTSDQPHLDFDFSPGQGLTNEPVYFLADANNVVPGLELHNYDYTWDFGDGSSTATGDNPNHTYTAEGTYTVTLSVPKANGESSEHTFSKEIVVSDTITPIVNFTIQDSSVTQQTHEGETFTGLHFPEAYGFELNSNESLTPVVDVAWNFGDGEEGFGSNAEHVYHKPGTYTVTMTGYGADGLSDTATGTIVIPQEESCIDEEGDTVCFFVDNSNGNILEMSETSWELSHSLGSVDFATDPEYTASGWIKLIEADPGENDPIEVDISDIVTINDDKIEISKTGIVSKSLDLSLGYFIRVDGAADITFEPLAGQTKTIYFGSGSLNITASETDVRLIISQGGKQFKKYIKMGSSTSASISNLPIGTYTVEASKDERSDFYSVSVNGSSPGSVVVDLDPIKLSAKRTQQLIQTRNARKNAFDLFRDHHIELNRKAGALPPIRSESNRNLPGWAYGLCGQEPPFPAAKDFLYGEGEGWDYSFGSDDPQANLEYVSIPNTLRNPVKIRCGVVVPSITTSFEYWKQMQSGLECSPGWQNDTAYEDFLDKMKIRDQRAVQLKINLKDGISGQIYSKTITKTPAQLRSEEGLNLSNVTFNKGIWTNSSVGTVDVGYQLEYELPVPKYVKNPKISLEIIAPHETTSYTETHVTSCVLHTFDPDLDRIERLKYAEEPTSSGGSSTLVTTPSVNARYSIDESIKFFPLHFDSTNGPLDSNFSHLTNYVTPFRAFYELDVELGEDNHNLDWDKIEVYAIYNPAENNPIKMGDYTPTTQENPPSYTFFVKDNPQDVRKKKVLLYIDVDSTNLGLHDLPWKKGVSTMQLTFQGFKNGEPRSNKLDKTFNAMFDVKFQNALTPDHQFCSRGIYNLGSATISAYANEKMLQFMNRVATSASPNPPGFNCNDMSLPFGAGEFRWESNKYHSAHEGGQVLDMRYFNEEGPWTSSSCTPSYNPASQNQLGHYQNCYDRIQGGVQFRENDLKSYLTFSEKARLIGSATSSDYENDPDDNVERKVALKNYCASNTDKPPCDEVTEYSHITYDKVLKICQWYYWDSTLDASNNCPDLDSAALLRYSKWVEHSYNGLTFIENSAPLNIKDVIITYGTAINFQNASLRWWQYYALAYGRWPSNAQDPSTVQVVYKVDSTGTKLTSSLIVSENCFVATSSPNVQPTSTCTHAKHFANRPKHQDHMHIKLK